MDIVCFDEIILLFNQVPSLPWYHIDLLTSTIGQSNYHALSVQLRPCLF